MQHLRAGSTSITVFTSRAAADMTSGAIISEGEALLVDPGVLPGEIEAIADYVAAEGATVTTLLLTHHHWDHVLATQRWPAARRIAHPTFESWLTRATQSLDSIVAAVYPEYGFAPPSDFTLLPITDHLGDGAEVKIGALCARLVHLPGHAGDALGLLIPSERLLFSSDMLDSMELPMPDQDIDLHLLSLARIEAMVAGAEVETVGPGHGPMLAGRMAIQQQIDSDRTYLQELRTRVQAVAASYASFEDAWPHLAVLSYFGKGDPDRDHEHRHNAEVSFERYRRARGGA